MGASSQPGTVSNIGDTTPATGVGPSVWITRLLGPVTVQITLSGVGVVSSVVDVEVSNGPASAPAPLDTPAGTITLSSNTGMSSDGFSIVSPWRYIRFNVKSLSGTNASITGLIGV